MKILFIFTISFLVFNSNSQLNCKNTNLNSEKIITCFHKNGQKSTIETWDLEHRSGTFKAYNSTGNELFTYFLRTFGGHASVNVSYFPNGQVEKVEFSSAPDGGIQFYNDSRKFNENGDQIDFQKMEYPFETITTFKYENPNQENDSTFKKNYIVQIQKPEAYKTIFKLINTSNKKIIVEFQGQKNKWIELKNKEIEIVSNNLFTVDSISLMNHSLELNEIYKPVISEKTKKSSKYKLIFAQPIISEKRIEYTWIIVKNN